MFRLLLFSEGAWGQKVAHHIMGHAPSDWDVVHRGRGQPRRGPTPDLLVVLAEGPPEVPRLLELSAAIRPAALLVPVENPAWISRPERKRLTTALTALSIPCTFPSPFCALSGHPCPAIATFAHCFGRPVLQIRTSARALLEVAVLIDNPCGLASRYAPSLCGVPVERAEDGAWNRQAYCPGVTAFARNPPPYFPLAVRLALAPFDDLVEAHRSWLLEYAHARVSDGDTAEDLVQETLLRAYQSYHQLKQSVHLRAWLRSILENVIRTQHRQQNQAPEVLPWENLPLAEEVLLTQQLPFRDHPEEAFLADILPWQLEEAFQALPPHLRDVLYLAAVEELPHREIAGRLGCTLEAVDKRLSRARSQMRAALERPNGRSGKIFSDPPPKWSLRSGFAKKKSLLEQGGVGTTEGKAT